MYSNQQLERAKLRKQLVDIENKRCVMPNCPTPYDRREIHRIKNGKDGGKYTRDNVVVMCFTHHRKEHPSSKFRIGDRVKLTGRVPSFVDLSNRRPKTIVAIHYDYVKQCNFYRLGSNARGAYAGDGHPCDGYRLYEFRSYQLQAVRRYKKRNHQATPKTSHNQKSNVAGAISPAQVLKGNCRSLQRH